ncbi:MAG: hypothetical protein KUG77_00840 [Nannocystaceae bacterium]|nr:hypothetical protein [Nannocystaceae bacterium]
MSKRRPPSALEAISAELGHEQQERRAHFQPALLLSLVVVIAPLVVFGVRPDLLELPPERLAVQILLWILCLVVFPALGVGIFFVGRRARYALALSAVALTIVASTGWPFSQSAAASHAHAMAPLGCLSVTLITGVAMLGIGVISGAFVQRRRASAVFWIAAGLSLVALNVVTWHCPASGMLHVVPLHLGGAAALLGLAAIVGWFLRRHDAKP